MRKARFDLRENEAVTVQPLGVLGVELHELAKQDVGDRCHTPIFLLSVDCISLNDVRRSRWRLGDGSLHGGTRVAGVRLGGGIGLW